METERSKHWENIYRTKELNDVSWYQPTPITSLNYIQELNISKTAKIIDIGGGDSLFADHLIEFGYQDITVLDISAEALERAKKRLGSNASKVKWIASDIVDFTPTEEYDLWHDRATFHFLVKEDEIKKYVETVNKAIKSGGYLILGTFSEQGPEKCSGLNIKQYSEGSMNSRFDEAFEKLKCKKSDHKTPSGSIQNFIFCSFRKY
ncbi:MAG: class I SAM-dependent methyltransferase [Candidatus Cyclobacteriaceae bacterium M2_1C_046]